jgi:hypothetical protein
MWLNDRQRQHNDRDTRASRASKVPTAPRECPGLLGPLGRIRAKLVPGAAAALAVVPAAVMIGVAARCLPADHHPARTGQKLARQNDLPSPEPRTGPVAPSINRSHGDATLPIRSWLSGLA